MKIKLSNNQYLSNLMSISTIIENGYYWIDLSFRKNDDFVIENCSTIFSDENISSIEIYQEDVLVKTIDQGFHFLEARENLANESSFINVKIAKSLSGGPVGMDGKLNEIYGRLNFADDNISELFLSVSENQEALSENAVMIEDLSDAAVELGDMVDESTNINIDLIDAVTELGDMVAEQADTIIFLQEMLDKVMSGETENSLENENNEENFVTNDASNAEETEAIDMIEDSSLETDGLDNG